MYIIMYGCFSFVPLPKNSCTTSTNWQRFFSLAKWHVMTLHGMPWKDVTRHPMTSHDMTKHGILSIAAHRLVDVV